ncbi:thyroid receptor-interacting protein 11 isoform X2 [Ooceraea biroi]|nr:thyroid receptor-interacting protein 11 isoform X2 [Ooceraea biroi]
MMNRIIQMEEKTREAERNARHIQLDEATLTNDFRSVISKLNSREKFDLINGALKALQIENETFDKVKDCKMSSEELKKVGDVEYNPLVLKHHFDANLQQSKPHDTAQEFSINKEETRNLRKRIEELGNENKDLLNAMEKLDEEHTQSIEKLLSLREETTKKHHSLQNAYDQLSLEYNEAQRRVTELQNNESKLDKNACIETSYQSVQTDDTGKLDRHTEMVASQQQGDAISKTSVLDDITQKVKTILRNYTIRSVEAEESIFETIAKQYVDARWKLDILERKVTEVTRELKETEEIKDGLQMECEELQSHIDSYRVLLENQALIKSSLPCIPEASEERVASLETDIESLREEVKRLLVENKTIQEMNSTLMNVARSKKESANQLQEDINRKVHSSVEEDKKCLVPLKEENSLNEDITATEQLKFDYENVKRELSLSMSNIKLLENNLASLEDTVDRLTQENNNLLQTNRHLDTQLCDKTSQEHGLQEKNDCLLDDLRKQLDAANRENTDLQNDILYKEKELDGMGIQIDIKQSQVAKLNQDNDRLIKENISLSEQLTATHDESLDKIELLNTEMELLQQEHEDLKQETSSYKEELVRMKERLHEAQESNTKLENEYHTLRTKCDQHETGETELQSQVSKTEKLENELSHKKSIMEEIDLLRNKCKVLEQEIEVLRAKKTQKFQEDATKVISANTDKTKEEELATTTNDSVRIEDNTMEHIKTESQNLEDMNIIFNERERKFVSIIDEERREKDIVKAHNEKLMHEITELHNKCQIASENRKESAEMAKQIIEDLSHLVREKDEEINVLQAEITRMKDTVTQISNELIIVKNQKEQHEQLISVKHNEGLHYQNEIQRLIQHINEQAVRIQELASKQTTNETREEQHLKKDRDSCNETIDQSRQNAEITILREKCDALETALIQEQSNNRILQNQLIESQNKEANSAKELERLRTHLVEMESSYTEEALIAETSRQELEARLLQAEEKVKSSSTAFTSASIRANQQVETLQQQIALITQQRDHIQAKLSNTEDKILQQSASLTNLQVVLEQFQQDKERDIILATEKIQSQLNESHKKQNEFLIEISILKQQLSEAKECLQAASRLSEQLEKKDEQIVRLNEEVAQLATSFNFADQKMKEVMERDETKVDKILIKNLLLGYLSSTTSDKSSILRVFANVLDFTESEKDKTGLNGMMAQSSRVGKNSTASLKEDEPSLSTAFVRFLESESKPKPQLPALPIVNSTSSRPGHNKQSTSSSSSSSSTQPTLLLSNVALPTFPDFVPARNTGSILKEVLKDS